MNSSLGIYKVAIWNQPHVSLMLLTSVLVLLSVISASPFAWSREFGEVPPIPPEAARIVSTDAAVIEGMPQAPRSREILDRIADVYSNEIPIDGREACLYIARSFPDSNLGIYALSIWLGDETPTTAVLDTLRQFIGQLPDSRIANFALSRILGSTDDIQAVCLQITAKYPKSRVAYFAQEQLARELASHGDQLPALEQYLQLHIALLENQPEEHIQRIARTVVTVFIEASLPFCAAIIECSSDGSRDSRLVESARLLSIIKSMSRNLPNSPTPDDKKGYPALWESRNDSSSLLSLTVNGDDPDIALHAQLLLANMALQSGDTKRLTALLDEFIHDVRAAALTHTDRVNHLIDLSLFLAWSRNDLAHLHPSVYSERWSKGNVRQLQGILGLVSEELATGGGIEVATLLRLKNAFRCARITTGELETIRLLISTNPNPETAASLHREAAALYWNRWRDYRRAAKRFRMARELLPRALEKTELYLMEAKTLYLAGDFNAALDCLEEFKNETSYRTTNELTERARFLRSVVHIRKRDSESAIREIDALIADGAEGESLQRAAFLRAFAQYSAASYMKSFRSFEEFIEAFPESSLAGVAARILSQLKALIDQASQENSGTSTNDKPNIVLISLDTVRADHLGCYGYPRNTTPNIDQLANDGVLFTAAVSTSSWTKPSHASVFSSLYPGVHGAISFESSVVPEIPLMPQILRHQGYRTVGIVSAPPLDSAFGFNRGFDLYDDYTVALDRSHDLFLRNESGFDPENFGEFGGPSGAFITSEAIFYLDRLQDSNQPSFLFLNYFDAHANYLPPWPYSRSHASSDIDASGAIHHAPGYSGVNSKVLFASDLELVKSLYDGEISYVDEQIGRLVRAYRELGEYENTIFLLFGDHGEEFLEHEGLEHGRTLYEEVVHIPLIITGPGVPRGVRNNTLVSLVDVLPTILNLVDVEPPEILQGRNILALLDEPRTSDRFVFSELSVQTTLQSLSNGNEKLVFNPRSGFEELYYLPADPLEIRNLADEANDRLNEMLEMLSAFNENNRVIAEYLGVLTQNQESEQIERMIPDELTKRLRSLGYF